VLSFTNVSKQYGKQVLFVDASFQLNPGEKVGLVGPNGSGKTTVFRLIVGEESPDAGEVSLPKRLTVGYFRQDIEEMSGRSCMDEAIAGSGRVGELHHELEALQNALGDPADDMDAVLAKFGEVQEEYEHLGGYALESQARECCTASASTMRGLMVTWGRSRAAGRCASPWRARCLAGPICCSWTSRRTTSISSRFCGSRTS
jgi:ATPase subunit of ABC transporter with duplicated ATPase domains